MGVFEERQEAIQTDIPPRHRWALTWTTRRFPENGQTPCPPRRRGHGGATTDLSAARCGACRTSRAQHPAPDTTPCEVHRGQPLSSDESDRHLGGSSRCLAHPADHGSHGTSRSIRKTAFSLCSRTSSARSSADRPPVRPARFRRTQFPSMHSHTPSSRASPTRPDLAQYHLPDLRRIRKRHPHSSQLATP